MYIYISICTRTRICMAFGLIFNFEHDLTCFKELSMSTVYVALNPSTTVTFYNCICVLITVYYTNLSTSAQNERSFNSLVTFMTFDPISFFLPDMSPFSTSLVRYFLNRANVRGSISPRRKLITFLVKMSHRPLYVYIK